MSQPCRVYKLPIIADEPEPTENEMTLDELRRKAGLPEKYPPALHKRIARFYAETWEKAFEGTGPAIYTILLFLSLALAYAAIGRATGWWGGAW